MPQRKESRGPAWLTPPRLFLLFVGGLLAWSLFNARDATAPTLRYGEFKRLLDLPGVSFKNVKVSRTEVRGEIITRDRVSGLEKPKDADASYDPTAAEIGRAHV